MNIIELNAAIKAIRIEVQVLKQELIAGGVSRRDVKSNKEMVELNDILAELYVSRFMEYYESGRNIDFYECREAWVDSWSMYQDYEDAGHSDVYPIEIYFPEVKYLKFLGFDICSLANLTLKNDSDRPTFPLVEDLISSLGDDISINHDANKGNGYYSKYKREIGVDWSIGRNISLTILVHEIGHYLYDIWGFRASKGYDLGTWQGELQEEWDATLIGYYILRMCKVPITRDMKAKSLKAFGSYLDPQIDEFNRLVIGEWGDAEDESVKGYARCKMGKQLVFWSNKVSKGW